MSRYHSYLHSADLILQQYKGDEPFASFLKKFFSQHKKYGSRDRKQVAHLCYCFFRLGKALPGISREERMLLGLFLCSATPQEMLALLKPGWNEVIGHPVQDKLKASGYELAPGTIFPWHDHLSEGIEPLPYAASHLQQPLLFIRVRPGYEQVVHEKLKAAGIYFEEAGVRSLSLPNGTRIEQVLDINREAVVQDLSSQQVAGLLDDMPAPRQLWDCCAASGGKSLMMHDIFPTCRLVVSDVRESILVNLRARFREAGIRQYTSWVADLSKPVPGLAPASFDLVVADVPCTGSGTWGRTPEQLYYFEISQVEAYSQLQQSIMPQAARAVKPGGHLLYITCSVFREENEKQVERMLAGRDLELIDQQVLKGYTRQADSMFAALLRKKA